MLQKPSEKLIHFCNILVNTKMLNDEKVRKLSEVIRLNPNIETEIDALKMPKDTDFEKLVSSAKDFAKVPSDFLDDIKPRIVQALHNFANNTRLLNQKLKTLIEDDIRSIPIMNFLTKDFQFDPTTDLSSVIFFHNNPEIEKALKDVEPVKTDVEQALNNLDLSSHLIEEYPIPSSSTSLSSIPPRENSKTRINTGTLITKASLEMGDYKIER